MAELDGIVDVRSHPTSHWPWWHLAPARGWLTRGGFTYEWWPNLGGWNVEDADLLDWATPRGVRLDKYLGGHFPKQRIGADADQDYEHRPEWESAWTSQGLHDYAWFTATHRFLADLDTLIDTFGSASSPRVALVCSEAMWWKCHRSMIADVLWAKSVPVSHVMPNKRSVRISEHNADDRVLRYPQEVRGAWYNKISTTP
jgi:uncharacterized protein (DUF488 family)